MMKRFKNVVFCILFCVFFATFYYYSYEIDVPLTLYALGNRVFFVGRLFDPIDWFFDD